jgi:hypothetical protein
MWSLRLWLCNWWAVKHVTKAGLAEDVHWMLRVRFQLPSQVSYVRPQVVSVVLVLGAPHLRQELGTHHQWL